MDDSAILKMLSVRAVHEFEEMKEKCTEYHNKYMQDHKRVQKLEFQFKQLKRASLLAVSEYENLHKTYTAEVASRQDVETRLAKVDAENKHLRKANDYAPNTMIIRDQGENSAGKGELEGLRGLVTGMKDELRRGKEEINNLKSDLNTERVSHEATQRKYRISQEHVKQLNSVSIMALEEYQELKRKHEIELECRVKAEEYATEMVREKASVDRKSKWFAEHTNNDETLKAALDNVDKVTRESDEEISKLNCKIKELADEVAATKDPQSLKDAERKMAVALDQVDLMQRQLDDSERRVRDVENDNRSLHSRLDAAVNGMYVPPPPPPPPVPPPMSGTAIRSFITKLGGKKKKIAGQPAKDDPRADPMAEMLERIKSGNVKLKSTRVETKQEDSAMGDLASMLSNLKRGRAGSQDSLDVLDKDDSEKQPEFHMVKLKKVAPKAPKMAEGEGTQQEGGELKKILERKRSAAVAEKGGPPVVAPKTDKMASLRQASLSSSETPAPQSNVSTSQTTVDGVPRPQSTASADVCHPVRRESESVATPSRETTKAEQIDSVISSTASSNVDHETRECEDSVDNATKNVPLASDTAGQNQLNLPAISGDGNQDSSPSVEEPPKRPPRSRSSIYAEKSDQKPIPPKPTEIQVDPINNAPSGLETQESNKMTPPENQVDPISDGPSESETQEGNATNSTTPPQEQSKPADEGPIEAVSQEKPAEEATISSQEHVEPTEEEIAPMLPKKRSSVAQETPSSTDELVASQPVSETEEPPSKTGTLPPADKELNAAMDEIEQLMNDLAS